MKLERLDLYYEDFYEKVMPLYNQHIFDNVCTFMQTEGEQKEIFQDSDGRLFYNHENKVFLDVLINTNNYLTIIHNDRDNMYRGNSLRKTIL